MATQQIEFGLGTIAIANVANSVTFLADSGASTVTNGRGPTEVASLAFGVPNPTIGHGQFHPNLAEFVERIRVLSEKIENGKLMNPCYCKRSIQ